MRFLLYTFLLISAILTTPCTANAQWLKTNGLAGGDVQTLFNFGDTLLASIGNELYFSGNHGKTWTEINTFPYMKVVPSDTEAGILVARAYDINTLSSVWIRTGDFFQTIHLVLPPSNQYVSEMFLANGYVYSRLNTGMYRSDDDGFNWEQVSPLGIANISHVGQKLTGIWRRHVMQSSDGGFVWDTIATHSTYLSRFYQQGNNMIAFSSSSPKGCLTSGDNGLSWNFTPAPFNLTGQYFWHDGTFCGVETRLFVQSTDLGSSWTTSPLLADVNWYVRTAASSGGALIIGGTQDMNTTGMFRSVDQGLSWKPVSFWVNSSSGKPRAIGDALYVSSPGGLYRLNPSDNQWDKIRLADSLKSHFYDYSGCPTDYLHAGNNLLLSNGHFPWYSPNQGVQWHESSMPTPKTMGLDIIAQFKTVGKKVIGWGHESHQYKYYISHDFGKTFNRLRITIGTQNIHIGALDVDNGVVFAVGMDKKLYRSDDYCASWSQQGDDLPISSHAYLWLQYSQMYVRNNAILLTQNSYNNESLFSFDSGQTWVVHSNPASTLPWGAGYLHDVLRVNGKLVAATQNGVFHTENNGQDWTNWSEGLRNIGVRYLLAHQGFVWASLEGGGIWKRPVSELGFGGGVEDRAELMSDSAMPMLFSPNPTSNLARLNNLESGDLSLYDVSGKLVLRQRVIEPNGTVSVAQLPAGAYQASFVTGDGVVQRAALVVQR